MSNDAPSAGTSNGERSQDSTLRREEPSFFSKLYYAGFMYGLKGALAPMLWLRDWQEYYNPPESRPNIIKTYECRPLLPVRIFFPSAYDQTSPSTLPTLFTIHGGGFCLGHARDDDDWNRAFADTHSVLVIALNYSKAPTHPFPTAPHDVEALLLAVLADDSLPIDRTPAPRGGPRTALLGFSAGGNLALSTLQLAAIKSHPLRPRAAISVYGALDLSITPPSQKLQNRAPQKKALPAPRGKEGDPLLGLAPAFDWSYIPYGHDLRDPQLSPHYVRGEDLPGYVCLVGAELDMLAHESWRVACRLAGEMRPADEGSGGGGHKKEGRRVVPDRESAEVRWRVCGNTEGEVVVGRGRLIGVKRQKQRRQEGQEGGEQGVGGEEGEEVVEDERYAFEDNWEGGGVKWLLVPDVLHGFDNPGMRGLAGGKEAMEDAVLKTEAYTAELARWLKEVVWK